MTEQQTYLQRVKTYVEDFNNPPVQESCMKAIKALRTEQPKFSYKWIYKALSVKEHDVWSKYGFGLLFVASYRAQINKMIEREDRQEIPTWDWFENDMED